MKIDNLVNDTFVKRLPRLLPSLKVTGLRARGRAGARGSELILQVVTPSGHRRQLYIGLRAAAAPSRIREAARQLKALQQLGPRRASGHRRARARPLMGYPVLASTFLSPRAREICREEDVGYLDLAGNCWLRFDDLYVEKIVEKNPFPRRGRPPSVFSPISSRILRALLEESRRRWQVGELARVSQVSLGQTSNVTRRLIAEEYVSRTDRRLRLLDPARLLDAWKDHYVPARTSMAYYSFGRPPEQLIAQVAEAAGRERLQYALTSFAAALLLAPFVRGIGIVQWYVPARDDVERWVKALDLRPVESGPNVVLLIAEDPAIFYRTQMVQGSTLVGTIQLYLDLLQESSRGVEQAEFLRRERLRF